MSIKFTSATGTGWTSPANAIDQNIGTFAFASSASGTPTPDLILSDLTSDLLDTSHTVRGIQVQLVVDHSGNNLSNGLVEKVQLFSGGTALDDKSDNEAIAPDFDGVTRLSYGGQSDLWGLDPNTTLQQAIDGLSLRFAGVVSGKSVSIRVYEITITIFTSADGRDLAPRSREDLDRADSPHALIWFLTIEHPRLNPSIRVVADWFGYEFGGNAYIAAPFDVTPMTDNDQSPSAELRVQNIDRRISEALENDHSGNRAVVSAVAHSSQDFDLTVEPRVPLDAEDLPEIYAFHLFELADVRGDVIELTGRITLIDITQEPWPSTRATADRFPGLFV